MGIRKIVLVALITALLPDAVERSAHLTLGPHTNSVQWKGLHLSRPTPLFYTLSAATTVTLSLSRLNDVVYTIGGATPSMQYLQVLSLQGQPLNFTAAPTTSWLSVSPTSGTTPRIVGVSFNPAGLGVGQYNGQILVGAPDAINSPQYASVALTVMPACSAPTIYVQPVGRTISSGQSTALTVSAGGSDPLTYLWYQGNRGDISKLAGVNSATFTTPALTATTSYWVRITNSCGSVDSAVATLQILASFSVSPSALNFAYQSGGDLPQAQAVTASATSATAFTAAASGGGWLTVSPTSGNTPSSVSVSMNPAGLNPGTYNGTITLTAPGASSGPQNVAVTLTVTSAPTISLSPSLLNFAYQSGGDLPQAQTLTASASLATAFTAAASGGSWLTVSPTSGSTPASMSVSMNPAGLKPGTYNGTITITAPGAGNSSQNVPVTLVIVPATPSVAAILNGASFANNAFAPGSIVSIFGRALGPDSAVPMNIKLDNSVDTILAGIRLLFDGLPAPLLFVQAGQINAIVPFGLAGHSKAHMQLECDGKPYNSIDISLADAAPALFTSNASGHGPGAILNQDGKSNSGSNPAQKGSIVVLYASGGGAFDRIFQDGAITGADLARLALAVSVQIDGLEGTIQYAGSAPGLVAGVIQINVQLPDKVRSGDVSLVLKVGGFTSQPGVTVAVQ